MPLALYSPQGDAEYGITLNSGAASGSKYSVIPRVCEHAGGGCGLLGYAAVCELDEQRGRECEHGNRNVHADREARPHRAMRPRCWRIRNPTPERRFGCRARTSGTRRRITIRPTGPIRPYATQSDTAPGNIVGSGSNEANYYAGNGYSVTQSSSEISSQNYLTATGTFSGSASYYGTYDQSGDVLNWLDTTVDSYYPVVRGGCWLLDSDSLSSSYRFDNGTGADPSGEFNGLGGFRVASIPEPNSTLLMLAGVAGLALMRGKRLQERSGVS